MVFHSSVVADLMILDFMDLTMTDATSLIQNWIESSSESATQNQDESSNVKQTQQLHQPHPLECDWLAELAKNLLPMQNCTCAFNFFFML